MKHPTRAAEAITAATGPQAATSVPTGRTTTYSFIASLTVDRTFGWGSSYVRHIVFTVNQHEHRRDNTTDVLIRNHDRPQDDFDFHIPARSGRDLPGILGEIHVYIEEQAARQRDNGADYGRRMALMGGDE